MTHKIRKLDSRLVINLKIVVTNEMKVRIFIACQLMKLSAFVLGANVDIKIGGPDSTITGG